MPRRRRCFSDLAALTLAFRSLLPTLSPSPRAPHHLPFALPSDALQVRLPDTSKPAFKWYGVTGETQIVFDPSAASTRHVKAYGGGNNAPVCSKRRLSAGASAGGAKKARRSSVGSGLVPLADRQQLATQQHEYYAPAPYVPAPPTAMLPYGTLPPASSSSLSLNHQVAIMSWNFSNVKGMQR